MATDNDPDNTLSGAETKPPLSGAGDQSDDLDAARTIPPWQIGVGKLLAGQYRIIGAGPLGSGGMGEVWKAEDTELGVPVALKLLPPMMAHDKHAIENLRRETLIGRQLRHDNICALFSFQSDSDLKFIVMEFVDGKTLAQILRESDDRRLSLDKLEPLARQIASALDYAHNATYTDASGRRVKGVLHRDIKPVNIMVTTDGVAKLMDFGIAREIHNTMTQITGRATLTPLYASPEQFRGETMTTASDVYSFAVVLYECLAGRPFVTPHGDLAWQILQREFEPLSEQSDHVNDALKRGLHRSAQKRPPTSSKLTDELFDSRKASTKVTAASEAPAVVSRHEQRRAESPVEPQVTPEPIKIRDTARSDREAAAKKPKQAVREHMVNRSPKKTSNSAKRAAIAIAAVLIAIGTIWAVVEKSGSPKRSTSVNTRKAAPVLPIAPPEPEHPNPGLPPVVPPGHPDIPWPPTLTLDCGGGVTMELVLIPADEFKMGSPDSEANRGSDEGPRHRVTISKPFYMGKYEVTQAQWRAVTGKSPSRFKGDNLPVEKVSWNDCQEFCQKLSDKTGKSVRLPTEAEWEYACRAGTTTPFHFGATISTDQANYDGNYTYGSGRKGTYRKKTTTVGSFPSNAWGLHDMHGNVWEWCQDYYGSDYYGSSPNTDPPGPRTGERRDLRGGTWYINPANCRSADRNWLTPDGRSDSVGFRVVAGTQ